MDAFSFYLLVAGAVLSGLELAVIIWYGWTMPPIAKTMYKASRRSTGTLVFGADDQGVMEAHLTTSKIAQGVLKVLGKKRFYWFGPRPTFNTPEVEVPSERLIPILDEEENHLTNAEGVLLYQRAPSGETELVPLLEPADKKMLDDLTLNIHKVKGINIPVMIGYVSKVTAVSPRLLRYLSMVHQIKEWGTGVIMAGDIKLLHPRILKEYFRYNLNPSIIDSLTLEHERIGEDRTEGGGWANIVGYLTILLLLGLAFLLYRGGAFTVPVESVAQI